jgi:CelD/BcsL family acetyltransferase involved in cellulose biosynthesis
VIYSDSSNPIHVIFYKIAGREVAVLNELFDIGQDYIQYFAKSIFEEYSHIHTIDFNRIKCNIEKFHYPYRVWNRSQDFVVQLPETIEEYRAKLGRHTKSNMNNYHNKLRREHDDFAFTVRASDQVDSAVVRKIIEMNRLRMDSKKIGSAFDRSLEDKMVEFAKKYGLVATISVNGRIAAGTVCYEVGNHCYAEVISHDPAYNKYSIGRVCIYLTIQSLIERGRQAFHMLWGENEYKYRFIGVKQDIYFVSIYRSEAHKIMSAFKHVAKYRYSIMIKDILKKHAKNVQSRLPYWE